LLYKSDDDGGKEVKGEDGEGDKERNVCMGHKLKKWRLPTPYSPRPTCRQLSRHHAFE